MPAKRSNKTDTGSAGRRTTNEVEPCIICGEVVGRRRDIPRHMKRHNSSDDKKHSCSWEGCSFSAIQKSNLKTHYRRHIKDKSCHCPEDTCGFLTSDPSSLTRHRKRWHNYIPRKNSKMASRDSPSVAFPLSVESPLDNFVASINPSSPHPKGLPFPPSCYYNYTWNKPVLHKLDSLAAFPETGKQEFQYPYNGQQEEHQLQPKDSLLPLLPWPKVEQVFPGHETTGQLHGLHGFRYGLEHQPQQQVPSLEVKNDTWFLSAYGSPIFKQRSLPVDSQEKYSSVTTGDFALGMEANSSLGLNTRFDSVVSGDTDVASSSSCNFNSVFFNLYQSPAQIMDPVFFTDATDAQPHQM